MTPARASLQSPGSAGRSPAAKHEEWVDNAETLATWSPAKYESFYSLQPPLAGGTSLRQAFEETLRKKPAVMPLMRPSSSPQKSASDDPVLGDEPSSDSALRSDDAEAKNSLRSEGSAGHKRKLAGSEDGTVSLSSLRSTASVEIEEFDRLFVDSGNISKQRPEFSSLAIRS